MIIPQPEPKPIQIMSKNCLIIRRYIGSPRNFAGAVLTNTYSFCSHTTWLERGNGSCRSRGKLSLRNTRGGGQGKEGRTARYNIRFRRANSPLARTYFGVAARRRRQRMQLMRGPMRKSITHTRPTPVPKAKCAATTRRSCGGARGGSVALGLFVTMEMCSWLVTMIHRGIM